MEPTHMVDGTCHEDSASQDSSSRHRRISPGTTRTGGYQARGHHFEAFTIQDHARVHTGDVHSGQHTHYHGAPPSHPHSEEISLLDALAFEQMDFRSATIAPAYAETGDWLFSAPPYQRWREQNLVSEHNGFLWIKGKPGAGKSTLMKHAWEHAQVTYGEEKTVSFFFNARGVALGKSVEGMYRCLLHQMVGQAPHLERRVAIADRRAYRSVGWPIAVLQDLFRQTILHLSQQTKVSFYIDALDEGDDEEQVRGMVDFFYEVAERAVSNSLPFHICLASRYYPKISVASYEELRLEDYGGHDADIAEYVHNKLRLGNLQLKQHLSTEIRRRSSSVFLWVVLVVAILNKENDRGNQHLLLTRLREIPNDLLQLFQDLRSRDSSDNRFLPAIEWALHARRPLKAKEMYVAILASTGMLTAENFAWIHHTVDRGAVEDFITSSSKGFLEVGCTRRFGRTRVAPVVQFIHETVREYFLVASEFGDQWLGMECAQMRRNANSKHYVTETLASTTKATHQAPVGAESAQDESLVSRNHRGGASGLGSRSIEDNIAISHARLSQICQEYIRISYASDAQQESRSRHPHFHSEFLAKRPFLLYSLKEVLKHAIAASTNRWPVSNLAKDFPWDQWVSYKLRRDGVYPPAGHAYHRMDTRLQRMVYKGQPELVSDELLSITARAKRSLQGEETAQSLLNACASGLGSALHIAASFAHSDPHLICLKLLLDSGADVNKVCKDVGTPLHVAMIPRFGHDPQIDGLLLEHGADPNAKDRHGNSPLHYAVKDRAFGLVELLARHGADFDAKDHHGNSFLHYATLSQDFDLVKTLVVHGADLNSRIGAHGNAAQTAERLGDWRFKARLADLCAGVGKRDSSSTGRVVGDP